MVAGQCFLASSTARRYDEVRGNNRFPSPSAQYSRHNDDQKEVWYRRCKSEASKDCNLQGTKNDVNGGPFEVTFKALLPYKQYVDEHGRGMVHRGDCERRGLCF